MSESTAPPVSANEPVPVNERLRHFWLAALLILITLAAYQPVWHAGFVWDDDSMLLKNTVVQQQDGWHRAWVARASGDYLPVTMMSLWLEWRLWGDHSLGYHLDNLALHLVAAFLLWRILARLKVPGAWLAAALFAVHPVNVESVAWVTQRKNTLSMVFFLATVDFYLLFEETQRRLWLAVSMTLFFLALMSKTAVVPLPVVLLGLAWWRKGKIERTDVLRSFGFFALAVTGSLLAVWVQYGEPAGAVVRADSFRSRLVGAGWAVWFYLWKDLLPVNLMFVYPRWQIDSHNVVSYLPLVLLAGAFVGCWIYRRSWGRTGLFCLGYFCLMLLPVLGFLNIYFMRFSFVADHWQYFAIIAPVVLVAAVIKNPLWGLPVVVILAALTWKQSSLYTNSDNLWRATLRANPSCWIGHVQLGVSANEKNHIDEAVSEYREALRLNWDTWEAHVNLGDILMNRGEADEALDHFRSAIRLKPDHAQAHNNLGNILLQKGDPAQAIPEFQKALDLQPGYAKAENNLGMALLRTGDDAGAIEHFERALKLETNSPSVENNLAWLLATSPEEKLRNGERAVALAEHANLVANGENPMILVTLSAAYAEARHFPLAVQTAQSGLDLARQSGNERLAAQFNYMIDLFKSGAPFHKQPQKH